MDLRLAVPADAGAIGDLYARAFANDPMTSWVTPDAVRRTQLLRQLNTAIARYEGIPHGATYVAQDAGAVVGAAIWQPPGAGPISWNSIPFALVAGRALGRDMGRMIAMGRAVAAARRGANSWYLQLLGIEPGRQGTGVGSALVREHLRVVDEQRAAAYLETTVENLGFYARLGFEVVGQIGIGRGAPVEYSLGRVAGGG
jgi:ribosomal protein S18 acetylase RimI-like enzyme